MSEGNEKNYRRESLQATLQKRKECTARALKIVEKFLEGTTEEELAENLKYINEHSFQDAIDERSIVNLCGYPLCKNELKDVPKHQYKITRSNGRLQLYDTTERKKFCSNICYKAAKYLKDQLPSCPLWLIENEQTQCIKLIPLDSGGGSHGDEIHFGLEKVDSCSTQRSACTNFKVENINKTDKVESIIDNADDDDDDDNYKEEYLNASEAICCQSDVKDNKDIIENICNEEESSLPVKKICIHSDDNDEEEVFFEDAKDDILNETVHHNNEQCNDKEDKNYVTLQLPALEKTVFSDLNKDECIKDKSLQPGKRKERKSKHKKEKNLSPMLAAVLKTEKSIRNWVSLETLYFILGEDKLKTLLEEHGGAVKFKKKLQSIHDRNVYERYLAICKKLNILELNESKLDESLKNEKSHLPQKPIPDFEQLKKEAKEMELKVRSFYKGGKQVMFENGATDEKDNDNTHVIPLVDQHAQKALRRRIVLDHLNRVLPDILTALGLNKYSNVSADVKRLVETFTLSANNIVFRPAEWTFIGIIIIKLLSVRDEILEKMLALEKSNKYLTLMLLSYEQDTRYLDRLVTWLIHEHDIFCS